MKWQPPGDLPEPAAPVEEPPPAPEQPTPEPPGEPQPAPEVPPAPEPEVPARLADANAPFYRLSVGSPSALRSGVSQRTRKTDSRRPKRGAAEHGTVQTSSKGRAAIRSISSSRVSSRTS